MLGRLAASRSFMLGLSAVPETPGLTYLSLCDPENPTLTDSSTEIFMVKIFMAHFWPLMFSSTRKTYAYGHCTSRQAYVAPMLAMWS